jgi:hypothetical protein
MIYSSEVAVKSPSAGAKSLSFWGNVESFYTWDRISSIVGGVTQFALGFVPILGGAIDCAKGAYALINQSDFDLVEVELGCVGMSVDAIMTAASIADGCTTCPGYLANKAIMIALKRINQISKAVAGWMTKAFLGLLERFRERGVFYAKEFIDRIGNLKFLKEMDEAGETVLLEKSDNIVGNLVKACTIGPRSRIISTRGNPDECLPHEALDIFAKAGQRAKSVISEQDFVNLTSEVSGIPGLRRVDPTNELGGGPLTKLATGKLDESGAGGAIEEMRYAAKHKADLDVEMGKPIATSRGNTEIDLVWRDAEGKLHYDDVKSSLKSGSPNTSATEQARKLCLAARGGSAIGSWVIASIPSVITSEMGKWIYGLEKAGIKVVDSSGNRVIGDQSLSDADLAQKALDCR